MKIIESLKQFVPGKRRDYRNAPRTPTRSYIDLRGRNSPDLHTQIFERVCSTKAKHMSLVSMKIIKHTAKNVGEEEILSFEEAKDHRLYKLLTLRPNNYQTMTEFLWVFYYQLEKYGNAIAIPKYSKTNGKLKVSSYEVLDMNAYAFGKGFESKSGIDYIIINSLEDDTLIKLPYSEIIHQRKHPNAIMNHDTGHFFRNDIPQVIDTQLSVMLDELQSNFDIQGVFKMGMNTGTGDYGATLASEETKKDKVNDVLQRVKNKLIVLDAGEEYQELKGGYKKATIEEVGKLESMYYASHGISKPVIDGNASYEDISNFYNNELEPRVKSFREELNYKLLTEKEREEGYEVLVHIDKLTGAPLEQIADMMDAGVYNGWINRNEARSPFGWGPIPNGDIYTGNLNMANPDGTPIENPPKKARRGKRKKTYEK